ncbi:thiopeptide-type bacteriocin biosynthesis protein [Tenacibaculum sp. MEBiC06402]|uniref:thiopeptide-type bacteriocin biosynthesis protein n=1 Tax=unclassified Tenacibaculum TaxID=2635139 RepID=UPI003B9D4522
MVQRKFLFGDQWLYYKIYCGKKTSDTILTELIQPLSNKLLQENLIEKWFFIRYQDPQNHLRVRFLSTNNNHNGKIIQSVNMQLKEYFENGFIWNVQSDVYNRELERYGYSTISLAEDFFFLDSQLCLQALSSIQNDETQFLFSLKYIDTILDSFEFTLERKLQFAKELLESFKQEFNADKQLNKQLNIKYQNLRPAILSFFNLNNESFKSYYDLIDINGVQNIANSILKKLPKENILLEDLLSSYIHMTVNRLFRDKQRLHELVCYSCLQKYYQLKTSTNE